MGKISTDKTKKIGYYNVEHKTAVDLVNKVKKRITDSKNKNSALIQMVHNMNLINTET